MKTTAMRTKIIVLVIVIVFLVAGFQLLVNFSASERYITLNKSAKMLELYEQMEQADSLRDPFDVFDLVEKYELAENLHIEVFDETHRLVYTTGRRLNEDLDPRINMAEDPAEIYDFSQYLPQPQNVETRINADGSSRLMLRGLIEKPDGIYFVVLEAHLRSVEESVSLLNRMTFIVSLFMMLIGIFAAYMVSQHFSAPLKEIANVAGRVANLDFSKRANEHDHTQEISSLAVSINTMADQLERYVTELQQKNELLREDNVRLLKMEELRRQLVANVSHELKSPLALMGGYAEILRDDIPGIDKKECCEVIIRETEKMNHMIRSLLQLSSLENDMQTTHPESIDFSALVNENLSVRQPVVAHKGLTLTKDIEPGHHVIADPHYLGWATNNFIENAISHTAKEGNIHVSLQAQKDKLYFSVFNEGESIDEREFDNLWDSFYKADKARTRSENNNVGLGLYIVKTVVTSLGGTYGVENTAGGVRFYFTLTKADTPAS